MRDTRLFLYTLTTAVIAVVVTLGVLAGAFWYLDGALPLSRGVTASEAGVSVGDVSSRDTVPDVVAAAVPAVVSVVITADVPIIEQYFEEQWNPFGSFFGGGGFSIPRQRQVGTEEREIGGGTGFFVSADGYLVTNRHVVDNEAASYSIRTNEGESFAVTVVAKDPVLDIAILKVADGDETFPHLSFAESEARLGESVIAIGNALAEFPNSVSVGVVSGLARNIVARDNLGGQDMLDGLIQTDAAINQGNSGGPLLNYSGEVVGVNVAMANGSQNIGFALPASMVASVYQSVVENGRIVRPYLGVRYQQITKQIAEAEDLPVDYGVRVIRGQDDDEVAVLPDSPAAAAGLAADDIILELDGERLTGAPAFASRLRAYAPGDTITLTVLRAGETFTTTATLEEVPAME